MMIKKSLLKLGAVFGAVALSAISAASFGQTKACNFKLQVDDTCHYDNMICAADPLHPTKNIWQNELGKTSTYPELLKTACSCTWLTKDWNGQAFFNFNDIKPGDQGEDTVSLHVDGQDGWMCAQVVDLVNKENGCSSDAEKIDDPACFTNPTGTGQLGQDLLFTIWKDTNCNNKMDATSTEPILVSDQPLINNEVWAIADSKNGGKPLKINQTQCLGVSWTLPADIGNKVQGDSITAGIKFTATASDGANKFVCGGPACDPKTREICDGIDNNCNGLVDEGNPGGGGTCSVPGKLGICAVGTNQCVNGSIKCVQKYQPSFEICDGKDNDCDGQTDEGNPGGGLPCNTWKLGICAAGTTKCTNGKIQCIQNLWPTAEICDGKDNNCDGRVDENNPGGGGACNTGLKGICSAGTYKCVNGSLKCIQNLWPSKEVWDGKDNDCDGKIDNSCCDPRNRNCKK